MAYKLKLKHNFAAAHQLKNPYTKACTRLHGHNFLCEIIIETNELIDEMVVDFTRIKETINLLDHGYLNDLVSFEPTAENISKYLFDEIQKVVDEKRNSPCNLSVEVWEAEKASITYSNF